ncbi:MAG TPA: hypothetical protein VF621_11080 [Pyrinomonadaceae bacterium]|jgi:hypothetical protein
MGLDGVELVMRVEETFGIAIPDEVASRLVTPNDMADFIMTQLEVSGEPQPCLTQRAFHTLRRGFVRTLRVPRRSFRPDALLVGLLPDDQPGDAWERVGREVGLKEWPSVFRPGWLRSFIPHQCRSVRDLVDYVLAHDPRSLKGGERRWTRAQVRDVLWRVIEDETAVKDFTGESRFVDDMGLD